MANKIYVPKEVPSEFVYVGNITNTYYDIYDKSNIRNTSGNYYRIYYALDPSYYEVNSYQASQYYDTNYQYVERSSSILSRTDNYKIITIGFCIIFLVVFLINLLTSIIKRGGILGGLL